MNNQDFALWLLAFALIIHTIDEGWLHEYQKAKQNWRSVIFNRLLFLDNLPIFIFSISLAMIGWRWPILGGILPAVGLTHPLLDHLGLSWRTRCVRPGSWTGLFLLLPLSIWVYVVSNAYGLFKLNEFLISGMMGLAISIALFWIVAKETQKAN